MALQKKPYLIIPFLVEQPTWGGEYICGMKGWLQKENLIGKKIGQSYELYGKSLLAAEITSSNDSRFGPDIKNAFPISIFAEERPFPLIKFTQAKGNSFQLHRKPEVNDAHWEPKAESWYFFEEGNITFGLKKGIEINKYKEICILINNEMNKLSRLIANKQISLGYAEQQAKKYIQEKNPWKFVNEYTVKKGCVVDLSGGGLHHSWEENASNPLGNIVYEVQQDVMDPVSTLRSFDQGKFKADGTVRDLQIEDYFKFIDTDEKRNTLTIVKNENDYIFDTTYYSLKSLSISENKEMESATSFHHIFVKEGEVRIVDQNTNEIFVGRGHSCFIPKGLKYNISTKTQSIMLLTFLR